MRIRNKKINHGKIIDETLFNTVFNKTWDLTDKAVDSELKNIIWDKTMSPVRINVIHNIILWEN